MIAERWLLIAGWLAVFAAGCGSPAHAPQQPEATETAPDVSGDGGEAFRDVEEVPAKALDFADLAGSAPGVQLARTQRRLGLDLRRQGRLEEAQKALEEARDLLLEHGSAQERASTLNDLGEVLFQVGDFEGLEEVEWQALELAESAGLPSAAAMAWNNLGVSFAARGLPSAALAAHGHCLEIRRGVGDLSGEAAALHNLGVQLLQLGRPREGVEELRRAVSLHRGSGATAELGQSLASLAWGLALNGQPETALATYSEALSVLTEAQAAYDLAVALEQRAQLFRRLGRLREAREDLERSLALAEENGSFSRFHAAYLHLGLGAVLRDQGQATEALLLLHQAVEAFETLGSQEGRVLAHLELARSLRAGGARAEAIAEIEAALAAVESARANLHLTVLRGTYLGGWQDVYWELVDLLAETALEAPDRTDHQFWAARAFAVSERARARALLDLLAAPAVAEGLPERAGAEQRGMLRRQVEQLEAEALAFEGNAVKQDPSVHHSRFHPGSQGAGPEPAANRLAALRRLRFELERLQESAANAAGRQLPIAQPAPLDAILRQLDDGTILLAYFLGPERGWLWRIDSQGAEVRSLAAGPQIEAAARNAHQLFPVSEQLGFRKAARSARQHLSNLVLGPLAGALLNVRIAVVPDGALNLIPFAALPLPSGEDDASQSFGQDHEVIHLPSASALVELRRRRESRRAAPRPLAVVADPVFETDDPRFGARPEVHGEPARDRTQAFARTRRALGGHFGRLLGSADEALRITDVAGRATDRPAVPVFSGFAATRELVTGGSLGGFQMLHFASHALVDANDPALAGLVLSLYSADGRPRDGLLRSRDLYSLRLSADLVVLSACQTALGQEIRGEGVTGLADGFFAAGASQLIVSLWEVDDRATAELMSRFYTHLLLHGRRAADALRHAQRELRDETEWTSPAYWAAFVALGDWEAGADLPQAGVARQHAN